MSDPYADHDAAIGRGDPDGPYADDESDRDYQLARDYAPAGGRRRAKGRGLRSCLVLIVVFALLMAGLYYGLTRGVSAIQDQFSDAADYPGPGAGEVTVQVAEGESVAEIGRTLKSADVVASVDAFIAAASANPESTGIQVGTYTLMAQMRAADALGVLVDPANVVTTTVTVPEGLRVEDIVAILADSTDFGANKFNQALKDPAIGLPDYAGGNPEGYLFPATYQFPPDAQPVDMITAMVARWRQSADTADLEGAAARLGYTPAELMTIASLIQAEGRGDDMPKISRVIYNRLENPDTSGTNGLLQIDAANAYGIGESGNVALTEDQLAEDTPYNTRLYPGLPPTPIEAPGDQAIAAAANPADGPWYYYVTVDLATGETRFSESYDEFLKNRALFQQYCETSDAC